MNRFACGARGAIDNHRSFLLFSSSRSTRGRQRHVPVWAWMSDNNAVVRIRSYITARGRLAAWMRVRHGDSSWLHMDFRVLCKRRVENSSIRAVQVRIDGLKDNRQTAKGYSGCRSRGLASKQAIGMVREVSHLATRLNSSLISRFRLHDMESSYTELLTE